MSSRDLLLPAAGLIVLSIAMAVAWRRQLRTRNAGVVDALWAGGLGALGLGYATFADGWVPRRILVGVLAGSWSARLTWHLVRRVRSEEEDGRYARLRAEIGAGWDRWSFWFFQAQAILAVLLSIAFLVPASAPVEGWSLWDGAALLLFVVALAGESLADRQLRAWRAEPRHRGRTCRAGLWRWSRHPNYFFEWLNWLVYPLLALGAPLGWVVWLAPALMLFLVLRVTGIPPTESRALETRGDDYRAYQRSTNAFFPGPPRAAASPSPDPSER